MRIQFPIRTLLLVTTICALLSLVARWLVSLEPATAVGIASAFGGGIVIGALMCLMNQHVTVGRSLVNTALVVLVAGCAWWFAGNFGSYMLGVVLGAISASQRALVLGYLFRLLGFTAAVRK